MKHGLVSIIVVSYNAEKYIEKTLRSCLAQTYPSFEILVLDNASDDKTVEVIKNMTDSRITVFEGRENVGPYAGLNFILGRAEGEYIAVQDHDDIWFPEKIAKQVEFLKNNDDSVACGTNTLYYFEKKEVLILNKKSLYTNFVDHTSLVFRNMGFRYDINHTLADEFFEKRVLLKEGRLFCIQEPLTVHRIKKGGGNLSSSRFTLSSKSMMDFFSVNSISARSFLYLIDLLFGKFLSEGVVWFVRRKITMRNAKWISLEKFQEHFPEVIL
jgi:glycosyltransferase involved in cell wall biosynthesis